MSRVGVGGQGGGVVGGRAPTPPPHPTTYTPLLPSPHGPLPLDPTTLDGLILIQKK